MQGRKGDDEIGAKMAELVMVCDKESEIRQQRLQNATLSLHKSLRSSKSNADQTISINENVGKLKAESRAVEDDLVKALSDHRLFVNKHNVVVGIDLNQPGIEYYRPILEFLRRSRVHHVLTNSPPLMITYIRQFWDSARIDCIPSSPVIRARINNTDIAFSVEDLRGILHLGTVEQENGPTEYPFEMRMGAFQRMGYSGDPLKGPYIKSFLYGQWRFLMHVMIVSLAPKKAGWDSMNAKLQSAMLSLVYNKPFSFSQFFFDEFKQQIQIGARDKFLLYPRFVMMIICHRLPNLPPLEDMVQVSTVDRRIYADCVAHHTKRLVHLRPRETALFGHLVDVNYVAPPDDGWMDVAQPEGAVSQPDVVPEVKVQEPQQVEEPVNAQEIQEVIEEVLHQLEQPQQGADSVNRGVAEELVQDTGDDVVRDDGDAGDKDSEAIDSDSDNDDGDDDYVIMQYGSKLVSVKRSGHPPESSLHGKRKMHADDYEPDVDESRLKPRQSKARRSSITEPTATTTTAMPTATTTIPVPTSSTTTTAVPTTSLPADSVHVTSPSEISRIAALEAQVASLNAQVAMLTTILAKQDERLQSVARMTEILEGKIDRNEYLTFQLVHDLLDIVYYLGNIYLTSDIVLSGIKFIFTNMNPKNPSEEYSFTICLENDIYAMLDCHPHLSEAKKLIQELNVTNGLYSFVRTMRAKFQELAAVGSLPKITSNPQETTIISMSAPFSSVSTDSGSSAKDDHSRQANRVGRKLKNVQGIQSSVLSPGSASSLRRSPRFKVKK